MSKTLGIISIKGGVGKTTISSSLAADLVNHYGKKVLLVDANFSAPNLGLHMDIVQPHKTLHEAMEGKTRIDRTVHKKFGVDVIPGNYVFKNDFNPLKLGSKISQIKKDYDFVILDSSPSSSEEILATMSASDFLFVVTTPDYPTMSCSLKAARLAKNRGTPIKGILINKIRDPAYELTLGEIESSRDIPVLGKIPDDKNAVRALFTRIPLSVYDRYSPFSREISRLSAALTNSKEKNFFLRKLIPLNFRKEEVNRQLFKGNFYTQVFK